MLPAEIATSVVRLDMETGKLFWLPRTPEIAGLSGCRFPIKAAAKFNSSYAGMEALTAIGSHGYHCGSFLGHRVLAHRVVWAVLYGAWPDLPVDHINGCRTDNRPCNLRSATQSENLANSTTRAKRGSSRFKGVYFSPRDQAFYADIQAEKKRHRLGFFKSEIDAARAYDRAALELFGEFARTNASLGLFNQEKQA